MIQFNDSILWFDSMIWPYDSTVWFVSVIRLYDTILWFDSMIRLYDSALWFDSMIQFNASILWFVSGLDSILWFDSNFRFYESFLWFDSMFCFFNSILWFDKQLLYFNYYKIMSHYRVFHSRIPRRRLPIILAFFPCGVGLYGYRRFLVACLLFLAASLFSAVAKWNAPSAAASHPCN